MPRRPLRTKGRRTRARARDTPRTRARRQPNQGPVEGVHLLRWNHLVRPADQPEDRPAEPLRSLDRRRHSGMPWLQDAAEGDRPRGPDRRVCCRVEEGDPATDAEADGKDPVGCRASLPQMRGGGRGIVGRLVRRDRGEGGHWVKPGRRRADAVLTAEVVDRDRVDPGRGEPARQRLVEARAAPDVGQDDDAGPDRRRGPRGECPEAVTVSRDPLEVRGLGRRLLGSAGAMEVRRRPGRSGSRVVAHVPRSLAAGGSG